MSQTEILDTLHGILFESSVILFFTKGGFLLSIFDLYTDEYLKKKKECFDTCLSKEFLLDLEALIRKHYGYDETYRIGNWDFDNTGTSGIYEFVKSLAKKHGVEELIAFLNSLWWYEYDDAMDTMFVDYGRKFRLYTPKRRYRNIFKANALLNKDW